MDLRLTHRPQQTETFGLRKKPGFAIIVPVSILVLLGVIAVGLLPLSSVAIRSSVASSGLAPELVKFLYQDAYQPDARSPERAPRRRKPVLA